VPAAGIDQIAEQYAIDDREGVATMEPMVDDEWMVID
jgi:hypothetical protein